MFSPEADRARKTLQGMRSMADRQATSQPVIEDEQDGPRPVSHLGGGRGSSFQAFAMAAGFSNGGQRA